MGRLPIAATALTALTYALVVFGAVVRASGAGLSCPDWPLCFGVLLPQLDFGVFFEFGHRVLASGVSLGMIALAIAVWRNPAARAQVGRLLLVAFVVLGVQVVLGGLTVLHLLASWTVTSHLVTGNALALMLAVVADRLWAAARPRDPSSTTAAGRIALHATSGLLLLQLVLGGLVASNFAGLACTEFPTCLGGSWFPTFDGPVGLQIVHRLNGYALAIAVFAAAALNRHGRLGRLTTLLAGLVVAQISVGAANVLLFLPVEVTAAHSLLAAMLVLTTGLAVAEAARSRRAAAATTAPAVLA